MVVQRPLRWDVRRCACVRRRSPQLRGNRKAGARYVRELATQVQKTYSYNAFVYGILLDANVELGNYKTALDDADKMVSIRPDIRSYSRISYLREIYGDIPGAIEAMKLAVDAGSPGSESTEWARVQLGKLYEQLGQMKYAEMHYTISLDNRPGYPYALGGLARIAAYNKDYKKAIELYQRADSATNDYSFREALVEMYKLIGDKDRCLRIAKTIVEEMEKVARAMARPLRTKSRWPIWSRANTRRFAEALYERRLGTPICG